MDSVHYTSYNLKLCDFSLLTDWATLVDAQQDDFFISLFEQDQLIGYVQYQVQDDFAYFRAIEILDPYIGKSFQQKLLDLFERDVLVKQEIKYLQVTTYSRIGRERLKPKLDKLVKDFKLVFIEEATISNKSLIEQYR